MRFWDSSAVIPLCLQESSTETLRRLTRVDPEVAVWWGTRTECASAIARAYREGRLDAAGRIQGKSLLDVVLRGAFELQPASTLRDATERLLDIHPLRAADAFQLAAAVDWACGSPAGRSFVVLDRRLREAAEKEGFTVLP